jgi:hypothetical protein
MTTTMMMTDGCAEATKKQAVEVTTMATRDGDVMVVATKQRSGWHMPFAHTEERNQATKAFLNRHIARHFWVLLSTCRRRCRGKLGKSHARAMPACPPDYGLTIDQCCVAKMARSICLSAAESKKCQGKMEKIIHAGAHPTHPKQNGLTDIGEVGIRTHTEQSHHSHETSPSRKTAPVARI